jgi:hypothetical protein
MNGAGTDVTGVPVCKLSLLVGVGMWLCCVAVLWGGQMHNTCTSEEYANVQLIYDFDIGYIVGLL